MAEQIVEFAFQANADFLIFGESGDSAEGIQRPPKDPDAFPRDWSANPCSFAPPTEAETVARQDLEHSEASKHHRKNATTPICTPRPSRAQVATGIMSDIRCSLVIAK